MVGYLALITDGDAGDLALGQHAQQLAHSGCRRNKGRQDLVHLGGYEGSVHGVAGRLALQYRQHLLGRLDGHLALRLTRGRAQVRREGNLGMLKQGAWVGRLLGKHVQGHTTQLP